MPAISTNDMTFIGNLNEHVIDYFSNNQLMYDPLIHTDYADKFSYWYAGFMKVKGPDLIKLSNLQNYLSEWDRPYTFGGYIRSIGIKAALPIDVPSFNNGTVPNNGQIRTPDIDVTYHPLKARLQFLHTTPASQLKDVMLVPEEMSLFLAGLLQSQADGANNSMYQISKNVFYKYYTEMDATSRAKLTDNTLPVEITNIEDAKIAINKLKDYVTQFMFGQGDYTSRGFTHTVVPQRQRLYINHTYANRLVGMLVFDHYMGNVNYADPVGSLSQFLGIPVKMLDDFGGMTPYGAPTTPGDDTTKPRLYPIYDSEGAVTGRYSATEGGATSVEVDSWGMPEGYNVHAVLTEEDFGNVFPVNDNILTQSYPSGGGYTNTFRYIERLYVAKPQSNTVYFTA